MSVNYKYCSECSTRNDIENNYCSECGHKLKYVSKKERIYKKYCTVCGTVLDRDDEYCGYCGNHSVGVCASQKRCSVCGEPIGYDRYCWNCGHDTTGRSVWGCEVKYISKPLVDTVFSTSRIEEHQKKLLDLKKPNKCPNCNTEHQRFFSYCERCGTKLVRN